MKGVIKMISKESIKKELMNEADVIENGILTYSTNPKETKKLLEHYSNLIMLVYELRDALND